MTFALLLGGNFIVGSCFVPVQNEQEDDDKNRDDEIDTKTSGYWSDSGNYATSFTQSCRNGVYNIATAGELALMACILNEVDGVADGYDASMKSPTQINIIKDIDLSEHYWTPISNSIKNCKINGGGNTILGLRLLGENGTYSNYQYSVGLFRYFNNVNVQDLNIEDANITSSEPRYNTNYAFLVGQATSTSSNIISNVSVSGTIDFMAQSKHYLRVGGIAGNTYSYNFENCSADVTMSYSGIGDKTSFGGMVGLFEVTHGTNSITNCKANFTLKDFTATGDVTFIPGDDRFSSREYAIGGLIGRTQCATYSTVLSNCQADGIIDISFTRSDSVDCYVGGIVGYNDTDTYQKFVPIKFQNCYNNLDIKLDIKYVSSKADRDTIKVGGICGGYSTATYCANYAKIDASCSNGVYEAFVGGVLGLAEEAEQCANFGKINVTVGELDDYAYSYGFGGVVGQCANLRASENGGISSGYLSVSSLTNYGKISIYSGGIGRKISSVGGVVGSVPRYNTSASIKFLFSYCINYGDIYTSMRATNIGGVVGYYNAYQFDLTYNYNYGTINLAGVAEHSIGGVVGNIESENLGALLPQNFSYNRKSYGLIQGEIASDTTYPSTTKANMDESLRLHIDYTKSLIPKYYFDSLNARKIISASDYSNIDGEVYVLKRILGDLDYDFVISRYDGETQTIFQYDSGKSAFYNKSENKTIDPKVVGTMDEYGVSKTFSGTVKYAKGMKYVGQKYMPVMFSPSSNIEFEVRYIDSFFIPEENYYAVALLEQKDGEVAYTVAAEYSQFNWSSLKDGESLRFDFIDKGYDISDESLFENYTDMPFKWNPGYWAGYSYHSVNNKEATYKVDNKEYSFGRAVFYKTDENVPVTKIYLGENDLSVAVYAGIGHKIDSFDGQLNNFEGAKGSQMKLGGVVFKGQKHFEIDFSRRSYRINVNLAYKTNVVYSDTMPATLVSRFSLKNTFRDGSRKAEFDSVNSDADFVKGYYYHLTSTLQGAEYVFKDQKELFDSWDCQPYIRDILDSMSKSSEFDPENETLELLLERTSDVLKQFNVVTYYNDFNYAPGEYKKGSAGGEVFVYGDFGLGKSVLIYQQLNFGYTGHAFTVGADQYYMKIDSSSNSYVKPVDVWIYDNAVAASYWCDDIMDALVAYYHNFLETSTIQKKEDLFTKETWQPFAVYYDIGSYNLNVSYFASDEKETLTPIESSATARYVGQSDWMYYCGLSSTAKTGSGTALYNSPVEFTPKKLAGYSATIVLEADTPLTQNQTFVFRNLTTYKTSEVNLKVIYHKYDTTANTLTKNNKRQYVVSSADDLLSLSAMSEGGESFDGTVIVQTNHIDMSGVDMMPIGLYTDFKGTYDGQNYIISNLFNGFVGRELKYSVYNSYRGMFAKTDGATIKNVYISNSFLTGNYRSGTLVGYAKNTTIKNCHIKDGVVDCRAYDYTKNSKYYGFVDINGEKVDEVFTAIDCVAVSGSQKYAGSLQVANIVQENWGGLVGEIEGGEISLSSSDTSFNQNGSNANEYALIALCGKATNCEIDQSYAEFETINSLAISDKFSLLVENGAGVSVTDCYVNITKFKLSATLEKTSLTSETYLFLNSSSAEKLNSIKSSTTKELIVSTDKGEKTLDKSVWFALDSRLLLKGNYWA